MAYTSGLCFSAPRAQLLKTPVPGPQFPKILTSLAWGSPQTSVISISTGLLPLGQVPLSTRTLRVSLTKPGIHRRQGPCPEDAHWLIENQTLPLHRPEPPCPHLQNGDIMEESDCYSQLPSKEGMLLPWEYLAALEVQRWPRAALGSRAWGG